MTRNIAFFLMSLSLFTVLGCAGDDDNNPAPPPAAPPVVAPATGPNPTQGLWVTFQVSNETFRAVATRQDAIREVIEHVRNGGTGDKHPMGRVVNGGQFNPSWSWHLDSKSFFFSLPANTNCSGKPSEVEANVDRWIRTHIWYCPQDAKVIEVKDCTTGKCVPFILPEDKLIAQLAELNAKIQALIADKSCDAAAQCRSIGFGSKPCGGFESYLIYSSKNTNPGSLSILVRQYNRLDKQLDDILSRPSDCRMIMPPALACQNNQCSPVQN